MIKGKIKMNTERKMEIENAIHSFSNGGYSKKELLPELLNLQDEIVMTVFGESSDGGKKHTIWDAEDKLKELNAQYGNTVNDELDRFIEDGKKITNTIRAEKSGNFGEYKAFRSLETLMCRNRVLKNIAFELGDHKTELDAIVFTGRAIFIVEVKNSHKDIRIDDRGKYIRLSYEEHFDQNIGEKMNDKVFLLKSALESAGYENLNIQQLVVFTNYINVENNYSYIKTCFLSDLPRIIDTYKGEKLYNDEDFDQMVQALNDSACKELYPAPVNMEMFKTNFATLIAKIQYAKDHPEQKKSKTTRRLHSYFEKFAGAAAVFAIAGAGITQILRK